MPGPPHGWMNPEVEKIETFNLFFSLNHKVRKLFLTGTKFEDTSIPTFRSGTAYSVISASILGTNSRKLTFTQIN